MAIKRGRIIWACFARGQNKKRPAVVISDPGPDGSFFVAVGSTQTIDPPPGHQVELPYYRPCHPKTLLHRRTVVDCTWIEKLLPDAIEEMGGTVPNSVLLDILKGALPHLPAIE